MKPINNSTETQPERPFPPVEEARSEALNGNGDALANLKAENEQLRTSIRLDKAHRRITGELERAGARSPGLLFDSVKGDLQFDDDGGVLNAAAIIKRLRDAFPEQFGSDRPESIDAGSGTGMQTALSREALSKMSASQVAELDWNDVKRVLNQG